jgi:agmatinase
MQEETAALIAGPVFASKQRPTVTKRRKAQWRDQPRCEPQESSLPADRRESLDVLLLPARTHIHSCVLPCRPVTNILVVNMSGILAVSARKSDLMRLTAHGNTRSAVSNQDIDPNRIDHSTPAQKLVWTEPRTFFGVPGISDLDDLHAQVAFLGVPYDAGTPQPGIPTGQAAGPAAARLASRDQFVYGDDGSLGWYDVETDRDRLIGVTMADVGDVAIQGSQVEANFNRMTEVVRRITERGALPVAVGGDHSVSFPLARGMQPVGEIDVVYFDGHADFVDDRNGSRFSGASEMRRICELPFVRSVTALGIRNVERDEIVGMRQQGVRWATTLDLIDRASADVVAELVPRSGRLYVSIDLDVLDISLTPGHSLPEPGGLSYRELRAALAHVANRGQVVGFDVAELNPALDSGGGTARIATWLITHFLSEIFDSTH